jgi:predicted nucleic acid-binding protein
MHRKRPPTSFGRIWILFAICPNRNDRPDGCRDTGPVIALVKLDRRIQVYDVPALGTKTKEVVGRLDPGEREAVALAAALDEETVLIMDDQAGRRAARHLDCQVTGVIDVLLRAKERGRIESVTPLLRELQERGYWLSDEIIEHARELADETTASSNDSDRANR